MKKFAAVTVYSTFEYCEFAENLRVDTKLKLTNFVIKVIFYEFGLFGAKKKKIIWPHVARLLAIKWDGDIAAGLG